MLKIKGNMGYKPSHNTLADPRNPRSYRKAVDVEELLRWTYQDQAADAVNRRVVAGLYPAGCRSNLIATENNGLLGTKIDCAGSSMFGTNDIHPDAEATHDAVRTLKPLWIGLVIEFAKTGGRPDWMPGVKIGSKPILRANGKPVMEYYDLPKRTKPAYCLLEYDPEPEHLEFVRGVYVEWWDALAALADKLRHLDSHEVTGPEAPRTPWIDEAR